ncbi:MAG: hypothetical protein NTW67_04970, partial [Candidatus Woesearchaeota archaeon]|nr:hypothetical protein [Candidatus Woesearchaeota archaeon]
MRNDALEEGIDRRMIDFTNRLHDRDKKAEAARALIYSCDGKVGLHYNEPLKRPNRVGTLKQFVYGLILVAGTYFGTTGYFQACDLKQQNTDLHHQKISAQAKLDKCKTVSEEREKQNTDLLKQTASYKELAESRVERSAYEEVNARLREVSAQFEETSKQAVEYKTLAESRVERTAFEEANSRLAETSSRLEDALKQMAAYRTLADSRVERSFYDEANSRLEMTVVQLEETSKQAAQYKQTADERCAALENANLTLADVKTRLEEAVKQAEQIPVYEQRLRDCEQQSWEYRRELRATDDFLGKLVAE